MLTRLRLDSGLLVGFAELRRLFVVEPVAEVVFDVGFVPPAAAQGARTLLPFSQPVRVTVQRQWSDARAAQDAFLAALLSSPVLASATELTLDGLHPGRTGAPLVAWLADSPFLGNVRSLRLARNGFTCAEACDLARVASLPRAAHLDATANNLRDPGHTALRKRFGEGLVV